MSEAEQRPEARHFDALDGLRGVAALVVLIGHATGIMYGPDHTLVFRMRLAVIFFFTLSGFVVTSAYDGRLRRGYPVTGFLARRVIRLYPMIIAGAVLSLGECIALEPAFRGGWRDAIASVGALLCVPTPRTDFGWWTRFPIDPPEWSLFYEICAYLLFAIVLVRLPAKTLVASVATAFVLYTGADAAWFPDEMPFPLLSLGAVAAFGTGMLLFRLHRSGRLPTVRAPFPVPALVIVVMCVVPERFGSTPDAIAFALACPIVMILGASRGRGDATPVERMLGSLSFPVYIVHWPFLLAARDLVQPRAGAAVAVAAGMVAAILAASLLRTFYDEPARRKLLSLLAARERALARPALPRSMLRL